MTHDDYLQIGYSMSISRYIAAVDFPCYDWQVAFLDSPHKRKVLNGARQSGKSTITSAIPSHTAKYRPKSLSIVTAATERQAQQDMSRILDFMQADPAYPKIVRSSDDLIVLSNGSRIVVVPATQKSARGDSAPDVILIDEAAWVEDEVFKNGISPMLTHNAKCQFIILSTPNGRRGFFYRAFNNPRWERYEVRSPWDVDDAAWKLFPDEPEDKYRERRAKDGIRAWYSPRHMDHDGQQERLEDGGPRNYRQEFRCEFVEPESQVFGYDEIERMSGAEEEALDLSGIQLSDDLPLTVGSA